MSALVGFEFYGNRDDRLGGFKTVVRHGTIFVENSAYATARGILFELYIHIKLREGWTVQSKCHMVYKSQPLLTIFRLVKSQKTQLKACFNSLAPITSTIFILSPSLLPTQGTIANHSQKYTTGSILYTIPASLLQITVAKKHGIKPPYSLANQGGDPLAFSNVAILQSQFASNAKLLSLLTAEESIGLRSIQSMSMMNLWMDVQKVIILLMRTL